MDFLPVNNLPMHRFQVTRRAVDCGFKSFTLFPQGTEFRVCMAVGLAVYIHSHVAFQLIEEWKTNTWRPRVSSLTSFADSFRDIYTSPAYWRNLPMYITELAREICQSQMRKDLLHVLDSNSDFQLDSDSELLRLLCRYISLDLVILRSAGSNCTLETIRSDDETGFPVVLAEEEGELLFLYHESLFTGAHSPMVPSHYSPPKAPVSFPGFRTVPNSNYSVLWSTHELIRAAVDTAAQLPSDHSQETIRAKTEKLMNVYEEYKVYEAMFGLEQLADALKTVEKQVYSDDYHPVRLCDEFDLLAQMVELPACAHRFHVACLAQYFQSPSASLSCPVCRVAVADSLISTLGLAQHAPEEPEPCATETEYHTCERCGEMAHIRLTVPHKNHHVCIQCFTDVTTCPACSGPMPETLQLWLLQASKFIGKPLS